MFISNFAISRPVVTVVVVVSLVVFGVIALASLQTDEFPDVNPPVISVSVPYAGASPEVVEREVLVPLEDAFRSISGVDEINSKALDGFASIVVTFKFEKDLQEASQDIRDKISEQRRNLPPEIEEPTLVRFDPQDLPIVSITLSSDDIPVVDLTRLADPGITGALRAINGVADVVIVGGVQRELVVELRPDALEASGVSIPQVVSALEAQNLAAPVGRITTDISERTIRLHGRLERPEDFADLVVASNNGTAAAGTGSGGSSSPSSGGAAPGAAGASTRPSSTVFTGGGVVRLGDIADVRDGAEEPRSIALQDGHVAVGIDVKKSTGASTTSVSAAVRAKVQEMAKTLPKGAKLSVVRDSGVRVAHSVRDVQVTLIEGALLTVLVVFLFLASWRSTIITGLALPVSVLASFVAVKALGFTLNSMSLLGLSLAIGILIDDAIVVRENIVRHMERGQDHTTAAREGTSEIGLAVSATTFAIVVVFVPVAFMGGVAQQWFAPFALTIAASVLVSLFVSFSLDPMLSAVWADPEVEGGARSRVGKKLHAFNAWFERRTKSYEKIVAWALRHRLLMVGLALAAFIGALAMPATGVIGSSFFPTQDRSELGINLETPPGSSLEYTRKKTNEIAAIARSHPEVAYTYATIGGQSAVAVDEANIYVRLVPRADREKSQQVVEQEIRAEARGVPGVETSFAFGFIGGDKQVQLRLRGPDLGVLDTLAQRYSSAAKQVPGAADIGLSTKGRRPELEVVVDRDLALTMGVTAGQVAQSLRPAFAGIDAGDWVDPSGKTRDVEVRLVPGARTRPADIERLPIATSAGVVPLSQVASVKNATGPALVQHLDGERVIVVGANTENVPLSAVVNGIEERTRGIPLPAGYTVSHGGETKSQNEVFGRIFVALAVALMLMYMILVVQLGSFVEPLAIMASLPLSLIGVMLALLVTGSTLNLMSMIGVILLMGIVAKNAILLIDFAKAAQRRGLDRESAIVKAGGMRLRPILMTSVAIVAGMLPVAIGAGEGGDFRAPLGRAVIGGVVTSTILTLLVIPTIYDVLATGRDRVVRRLKRVAHRHDAAGETAVDQQKE